MSADASDVELRAWLGREEPEPVLEPELEIIDPHHHLWDHRACFAYSCMPTHVLSLKRMSLNEPTLSTLVAHCLHLGNAPKTFPFRTKCYRLEVMYF